MINIIFETHSTTFDNEKHITSGLNNVGLSPLGIKQAKELGKRYQSRIIDVIFCSALKRSLQTAKIAFRGRKIKIIKDKRLNEIDYGKYAGISEKKIKKDKI